MSCGITEEEINEQIAIKKQIKELDFKKCKRCESPKSFVVLQKQEVFCKLCFNEYCESKFRSTIGKTNMIKPNHNVLIAYSGGQNSTAMLELVKINSQKETLKHILLIKPSILYIDETIILNDKSKAEEYNKQIDRFLNKTVDLKKYFTKLEFYFKESSLLTYEDRSESLIDKDCEDKFNKVLNSFKSMTAKEEFIRRIRTNLISRIAKSLKNIDSVFLGSNRTRLSIQLLTDVAQGKGNQVDSETYHTDDRHDVKFFKPMREFTSKEVVFWNKLKRNEFVEIENLSTMRSAKSSIGKITEQFINHLQIDYPATTFTISKISLKLQNQNKLKKKCEFCKSPVDEMEADKLSAQKALVITNSFKSSPEITFNTDYCYGCNILLKESNDREYFIKKIKDL